MSNSKDTINVDRKKLGMGQLFSELHPILSPSNDMDAEETVELLCMQSRRTRRKFAARINEGIECITSDQTIDVGDYINDDIRELAKFPVGSDGLMRLMPFVEWLQALHRENSLAIDRSRYSVNDAASHMERATGEFVRSCFENLMWHGVTFVKEGDSLILNLRERLWGKASLIFPAVETKFIGTFPMMGVFFWMDAGYEGGRFAFTFLIDVEFGDEELDRRAMQDRNWVRLSFTCDCPTMTVDGFDYGQYLTDFGYCGHRFIESWCGEVLNKEAMLGATSLSEQEKELLPLAKILLLSYQLADMEKGMQIERTVEGNLSQKVLEILDNRYGFSCFKSLFDETGQEALYKLLDQAIEAWGASDDFGETNKLVWQFARLLRSREREDGMRLFYDRLIDRMLSCSAAFQGASRIYGSYAEAENKMREIIEPKLLAEGFTGTYPHYRRRKGKQGQYISVNTYDMSNRTVNGVMSYFFSLSAAVKQLEKHGKRKDARYLAGGIPFEQSTAGDCAAAYCRGVKYAELGGLADGMKACIHVDVFEGISENEVEREKDTASELVKCVDVAIGGMKNKTMPRWYKKLRRKSLMPQLSEMTLDDMIVRYLPFGAYVSVLLLVAYLVCDRFFTITDYVPLLTGSVAVVLSVLTGLIFTLICAGGNMRRLKKRIWKY